MKFRVEIDREGRPKAREVPFTLEDCSNALAVIRNMTGITIIGQYKAIISEINIFYICFLKNFLVKFEFF